MRHGWLPHRSRPRLTVGLFVLLAVAPVVFGACGGSSDPVGDDAGDVTEVVDPAALLVDAAAAMGDIATVRFSIAESGAPVYLDPADSLQFESAIGQFAAPASAQAILTVVLAGGLRTELGAIAIGNEAWLQTALTGYAPLPASYGIDPASFFDPTDGWRPLLAGLVEPELVSSQVTDGVRVVHLRGVAPGLRISAVTAGLVDEEVVLDVWIDAGTSLVREALFSAEVAAGTANWKISLSEFGADVTITPPDPGG